MNVPDEATLTPDQMLLVMEMAGYQYIRGTKGRFPSIHPPGVAFSALIAKPPLACGRDEELRALFALFLEARAKAPVSTILSNK